MNTFPSVAVFVGSLRKESFSRKIAHALSDLVGEKMKLEIIEIGDLPLYNQDLDDEGSPPQAWTTFREKVQAFNAVLFVTPEYNRSVPAVLKNALDVGSRPYGKSIWNGKPGAVVSLSPGAIGGFGANHHLRQSLACLNIPTMAAPEAYLGGVHELLEGDKLTNDSTKDFLSQFMMAFKNWIACNQKQ